MDASGYFWVISRAGGGLYRSLSSGKNCDMEFPCETTTFQVKIDFRQQAGQVARGSGTLASAGACPGVALKTTIQR